MRKLITGILAVAAAMVFVLPVFAAGVGARAAAGDVPVPPDGIVLTDESPSDTPEDEDTDTDTTTPTPVPTADPDPSDEVPPPAGGNGWRYYEGNDYYFINGVMKKNYWAADPGASKWNFWYYCGPEGKILKGLQYIEDPNGTGWYYLQADNKNGARGRLLTGWRDTGIAGRGWFTTTHGVDYGKCTYTSSWGNYNPATGLWSADGQSHR